MLRGEASIIIIALELTAKTLARFARSSLLALGSLKPPVLLDRENKES
jgi:hypothetical protein